MEFFNKLGESINAGGQKVAAKTKEVAEVTSLNTQIEKNKAAIWKEFEEIGHAYYEQSRDEVMAKFPDKVQRIESLSIEIQKCQENILKARGIVICSKCGMEVHNDVKFCPHCGNEIIIVEEVNMEGKKYCSACNAAIDADTAFCPKCGAKQ